jgi:Icc-related predicted phosphoesterase
MKLLALSDQVVDLVYSSDMRGQFKDIDLVVGCGDLPAYYLEFAVSMLDVPLIYVPGNHDDDDLEVPGGVPIDGKVCRVGEVWAAGLGGSQRYKLQGKHQYTEAQMRVRVLRILWQACKKLCLFNHGIDLLVTHSPPRWIHDKADFAHTGFKAFYLVLKALKPKMLLHGHSHVHRSLDRTETLYRDTKIINVYPFRIIEVLENQ